MDSFFKKHYFSPAAAGGFHKVRGVSNGRLRASQLRVSTKHAACRGGGGQAAGGHLAASRHNTINTQASKLICTVFCNDDFPGPTGT